MKIVEHNGPVRLSSEKMEGSSADSNTEPGDPFPGFAGPVLADSTQPAATGKLP